MPKFDQSWNDMLDRVAERDESYDQSIQEAKENNDDEEAQRLETAKRNEWRPSGADNTAAAFRAMFD